MNQTQFNYLKLSSLFNFIEREINVLSSHYSVTNREQADSLIKSKVIQSVTYISKGDIEPLTVEKYVDLALMNNFKNYA